MPKITINKDKCKGCLLCVSVCPQCLISIEKDLNLRGVRPVKFSRRNSLDAGGIPKDCLGCAMCAIICPDCCIEVYK